MRSVIISSILLLGLLPSAARSEAPSLQDNVPNRYVVVPGDTLWGISQRFLKNPWKWPELWGMNREEIANPHLIYPGDVLVLESVNGMPHLKVLHGSADAAVPGENSSAAETHGPAVRLSPGVQSRDLGRAIPSIPLSEIGPFLVKTQIVDEKSWNSAPRIIAGDSYNYIIGAGSTAFVSGIDSSSVVNWDIFAKGREIIDPVTKHSLGFQTEYLGEARLLRQGRPSQIEIVKSTREVDIGSRLFPSTESLVTHFIPHSPDAKVSGTILSMIGNSTEIGQNDIVSISLGAREGIELGEVLAVNRPGRPVGSGKDRITLPDDRIGLVLVFKTYEHISYALVVQSVNPIHVSDPVQTP